MNRLIACAPRILRRAVSSGILLLCSFAAHGTDTYVPATRQLSMETVTIGSATYTNMVVTVGGIVSGPSGSAPGSGGDSYDPATAQLTVPKVVVGGTTYFNVAVTVQALNSIGGVSGADSFDGTDLSIAAVQVIGGAFYTQVVATVASDVSVAGGMPAIARDQYDPIANVLSVAAVEYKGRVYTNVTVSAQSVRSIGGSGISISSFAPSTAAPLSSLTITGLGFDPATAALSVALIPESGGPTLVIPAYAATNTSLQIMVPPLVDVTTGNFTAGVVDLQVIQVDGDVISSSQELIGLNIGAPPTVSPGLAVGVLTAAFLTTSQNVAASIQSEAVTDTSLATLAMDVPPYDQDLATLISDIHSITSNPAQSISITTPNGPPFVLNAGVLAQSDQLIAAFLTQAVQQADIPLVTGNTLSGRQQRRAGLPDSSADCSLLTGNASDDQLLCSIQTYAQQEHDTGAAAVQKGANVEAGLYLSILGGWAIDGLAEGGVLLQESASAAQLVWSGASSYIAALATASKPPAVSDSLAHTLVEVGDKVAFGGFSIGLLPAALDSKQLYEDASALLESSAATAPEGGLILAEAGQAVPSGSTAVDSYQSGGTTILAVASSPQVVTGTASCTVAQTSAWNNACLNTYNAATNACSSLPTLIEQSQCVNAALANFEACDNSCLP